MNLNMLRSQIDRIDLQLLRLLNRRAGLVLKVGQLKKKRGLPVFDGRREGAVLKRLASANQGPLTKLSVRKIFREVLRESRKLQSSKGGRK